MTSSPAAGDHDVWSTWLLELRHGGDPLHERQVRAQVDRFAARVLDGLALAGGQTLLDVGCGDGLLGLGAIERHGPDLQVVMTDISAPLLRQAERHAAARGLASQCRFVEGSAERLDGIPDASVDAVGTRAALAYVHDKPAALAEFWRVLKPGGHLSCGEPMWRDDALNAITLREIVASGHAGEHHLTMKLLHKWKSAQFPDTLAGVERNPLVNHSERDLIGWVQEAGFEDIHLELHIDVKRSEGVPWSIFLASSPHPWAPPLARILAERFTPDERIAFEALLRGAVETGVNNGVERIVYLTARKPLAPT